MSGTTPSSSPFWLGIRDAAPFLLVVAPFSLLFGVVATEAGLDLAATLGFSIVVIAGAAQFTAVSLLTEQAPVWLAIITALAVNLRMAMYSASLTPYLGAAPLWKRAVVAYFMVDQTYACSVARFEQFPQWTLAQRFSYFIGTVLPVCPLWYVLTGVGAMVGTAIPDWMALDFALPICFLAMIGPMLRTLPHLIAALVSVLLALAFMGLPAGVGLILAALIAMIAGAQAEIWMERLRHD